MQAANLEEELAHFQIIQERKKRHRNMLLCACVFRSIVVAVLAVGLVLRGDKRSAADDHGHNASSLMNTNRRNIGLLDR